MYSERGFTLIEVAVGALIGVMVVVSIGVLTQNLVHQRTSADSNSAAMTIAEGTLEQLEALQNPTTSASLTVGAHGPCVAPPCLVDVTGASSLNGPYRLQWVVVDNTNSSTSPLVSPSNNSKQITVTVTHVSNPYVRANLVTYYKVS
jgi:Tfp pilus assembly protein PilE